jgi:hypothetical protein
LDQPIFKHSVSHNYFEQNSESSDAKSEHRFKYEDNKVECPSASHTEQLDKVIGNILKSQNTIYGDLPSDQAAAQEEQKLSGGAGSDGNQERPNSLDKKNESFVNVSSERAIAEESYELDEDYVRFKELVDKGGMEIDSDLSDDSDIPPEHHEGMSYNEYIRRYDLNLKLLTWSRDSYGLFDFETR